MSGPTLYVIELGEVVKVGRSGDAVKRLAHHRRTAIAHGLIVGREWVSLPDVGTPDNEMILIDACRAMTGAVPLAREYFRGIPFHDAVRCALTLEATYPRKTRRGVAADYTMTATDVAQRLRISEATVDVYVRDDRLRYRIQTGGQRRFRLADVDALPMRSLSWSPR